MALIKTWTPPVEIGEEEESSSSGMNQQLGGNMQVIESVLFDGDDGTSGKYHTSASGTFANRPAAGNATRTYLATDIGVTFIDDGTEWHVFSHIPALCDRLTEDFHLSHSTTAAATGFFGGWRVVIGGAGGEAIAPPTSAHSFIQLQGDTGAGGFCNLTPKGSAQPYIESAGALNYPLVFEACIRVVHAADVDYHFGLMDAPSTGASPAPSSSIMYRVEDAGNVVTVTQDNGGGETTNDTGATPTNSNIDLFRIEVISATSVNLIWWKGGLSGTKYTESHTTNIPATDKLMPCFSVRTNAAAAKQLRIDSLDLLYKRDY